MKRWIILLASAMLLVGSAMAELALKDMDLEQLYALKEAVEARIDELEQGAGAQFYPSGRYEVGVDLPAGDYTLLENDSAVFANVVVREGPEDDARLISHHLINGRAAIRLKAGTWVHFYESAAYPLTRAPEVEMDRIREGGYLVGPQLPAGCYEASPSEKAPLSTLSVYDGILDTEAQLTYFDVLHAPGKVTLRDGEYVELSGCILTYADDFN